MGVGLEDTDFDALYELLSESYRRHILYYLLDRNHTNVDELSRQIVRREQDGASETVSEEKVERVTLSLIHNHIPRLVDHGLVNFDRRNGDLVIDDQFDSIRSTVERARTMESPDSAGGNSTSSFLHSDPPTERDEQ